jgi:hypothetical protein
MLGYEGNRQGVKQDGNGQDKTESLSTFCYLDLAIRLNIALATLDTSLVKALTDCNVLPFEVILED